MPWDEESPVIGTTGSAAGGNVQELYANAHAYMTAVASVTMTWTNVVACTAGIGFSVCNTFAGPLFPTFDPVEVAGLRRDWKAVKENRARKRAEIRSKRLFKRTVGDPAYEKLKCLGYHEILGASGKRYRLAPGLWVKVMGEGEKVLYELCAHLEFGIPWYDTLAVQHLMLSASLETEKRFTKIANKHETGIYPIPEMERAAA